MHLDHEVHMKIEEECSFQSVNVCMHVCMRMCAHDFYPPCPSLCRLELDPHVRDCVKSYIQPWLLVSRR